MRTTLLFVVLLVLLAVLNAPALAQDAQLELASTCVSEADFDVTDGECAAIAAVIRNRAARARAPFTSMLHAYSSRVFDQTRTDRRAWLAHLRADGAEPVGWPTHRGTRMVPRVDGTRHLRVLSAPTWAQYRVRWLRVYALAGRILRGDVQHACLEEPFDWGGDMDTHSYRERNLFARVIDCGETHNTFWVADHTRADFEELIEELAGAPSHGTLIAHVD